LEASKKLVQPYETIYYREGLRLLLVRPYNTLPDEKRHTLVWVHGGGWKTGTPEIFVPHMHRFAAKGYVNFSVEYRLYETNAKDITECMADVRSAVRYIRKNADALGVAPGKRTAIGESAGGHLVRSLVSIDAFNNSDDDLSVSPVPDIVINCNGVVDLTGKFFSFVPETRDRMPLAKKLSPMYNITAGSPPLLNLQGGKDKTVPREITAAFHEKHLSVGNDSELVIWDDASHAFLVPNWTASQEQIDRALAAIQEYLNKREAKSDMSKTQ
jgi:acetyl esterase/lipase